MQYKECVEERDRLLMGAFNTTEVDPTTTIPLEDGTEMAIPVCDLQETLKNVSRVKGHDDCTE